MTPRTPSETDVARKAYELWEAEGRPEGRDVAHWHQAERDVTEPVIEPIPDVPDAVESPPVDVAPKPKATRTRKPKAASEPEASSAAPEAKPKTTRRKKAVSPDV